MKPHRAIVIDLLGEHHRALHIGEIASRLGVPIRSLPALQRVIDDLCLDGTVVPQSGQRYRLRSNRTAERGKREERGRREHDASPHRSRGGDETPRRSSRTDRDDRPARERSTGVSLEGPFVANARGFGFVRGEGGRDVYISPEAIGGAMHGDVVRARIINETRRGLEGVIEGITSRRSARVSGTLRKRRGSQWLEPDDSRVRGPIVIRTVELEPVPPPGRAHEPEDGLAAVIELTRFPELLEEQPEGKLVAVLGHPGDVDVEVAKVLIEHNVQEGFPDAVLDEVQRIPLELTDEERAFRTDLTQLPLPTIDPADARDHDDAVWVTRDDRGYYDVVVAIADVAHFVQPGTPTDVEAERRGCSVYLPDRAVPMLPPALSSDQCSLIPDKLRRCMAVRAELDPTGAIVRSEICEAIMRSQAKLTYPGVARALGLSSEAPVEEAAEHYVEDLKVMWELTRQLRQRRMRRGALAFDLPEPQVVIDDETQKPLDVVRRTHDPGIAKAYSLVEELMLMANEVVAQKLIEQSLPGVFRNHASPDPTKLERFKTICTQLSLAFDDEIAQSPKKLSAFITKIDNHPQRDVLHTLLVRSMKQAVYEVENQGHFGLASDAYAHFTSPIRRYPDLLVHRALKAYLRKERIRRSADAQQALELAAAKSSENERRALDVERSVVDVYRASLMRDRIGDLVQGTVTGVVGSGVFVTLDEPFVDVLVPMEALGREDFELADDQLAAIGLRSGERIGLGTTMLVEIIDASTIRRQITGRRVSVRAAEEAEGDAVRPARRGRRRDANVGGDSPPRRKTKGDKRASRTPRSEKAKGGKKPGKKGRGRR